MPLPVIAICNQTTVLTDDQIKAVIPALQKQVTQDFKGYWETDCSLIFLDKDAALPAGWWEIVLIDNPDAAGALGYHELSSAGTPLGKVFAKLDLDAGQSWTVTLSHELLEMLADPWINWCAEGVDGKVYALEVADPVEADELGYEIDGVLVSDFLTPAWYTPTFADRYDFKEHLKARFALAPGGYISIRQPNGDWTQVTARRLEPSGNVMEVKEMLPPPIGSRRYRRRLSKQSWFPSTK